MSKKSKQNLEPASPGAALEKDVPARKNIAAIVFLCAVFLFSCVRAAKLSLVHDEALTFFIQMTSSFGGLFTSIAGIWMPNNHFLNSILIKIFTHFFGVSEFVIRLPALLGHALYLAGVYKISRLFLKGAPLWAGIVLLTLNPFVLDFFSCARGYGLGLGFFVLSLYFFFKRAAGLVPKTKIRNTFFCMVLLTLATFSHLTFVMTFLSVCAAVVWIEMGEILNLMKKTPSDSLFVKEFFRRIFFPIAPAAAFLVTVYARTSQSILAANEHLNAGVTSGTQGFWQDSIASLIDATLYGKEYPVPHLSGVIMFFVMAAVFGTVVFLAKKMITKKEFRPEDVLLAWSLALLVIVSVGIVLQHIFSRREYATDRWVIYLIPLFAITLMALWQSVRHIANAALRVAGNALFYLAVILSIVHFLSCVNFTHFSTWAYDATTREMLSDIVEMNSDKDFGSSSVRLGNNLLFEPSLNYYISRKNLPWLGPVDRRGPDGVYDYYCLLPEDRSLIDKYGLTVMKEYEVSGAILAKS